MPRPEGQGARDAPCSAVCPAALRVLLQRLVPDPGQNRGLQLTLGAGGDPPFGCFPL